mmetsp:Transcript_25560/g.71440  ORF Transcript_25560/g.71440 Transcript_25560/m.71440 type:complete len:306 (+) Transcript_25560:325-1242(+)
MYMHTCKCICIQAYVHARIHRRLTLNWDTGVLFDDVGEVLVDLVPVDNVPPVGHVLWSAVLVFEVVGMLPNVNSQNWEHDLVGNALHQGVVLVGCGNDLELVALLVDADPDPSGAECGSWGSSGLELGLHVLHGTEGLVDHGGEVGGRLGVLGLVWWSHLFPEEGVVVVPATAVADSRSSLEGIGHEVEDRDVVLAFARLVDVGDVGGMVLVMMELHGRGVNVRLQGLERVREIRDEVGVGCGRGGHGSTGDEDLSEGFAAGVDTVGLHVQGRPCGSGSDKEGGNGELHVWWVIRSALDVLFYVC